MQNLMDSPNVAEAIERSESNFNEILALIKDMKILLDNLKPGEVNAKTLEGKRAQDFVLISNFNEALNSLENKLSAINNSLKTIDAVSLNGKKSEDFIASTLLESLVRKNQVEEIISKLEIYLTKEEAKKMIENIPKPSSPDSQVFSMLELYISLGKIEGFKSRYSVFCDSFVSIDNTDLMSGFFDKESKAIYL